MIPIPQLFEVIFVDATIGNHVSQLFIGIFMLVEKVIRVRKIKYFQEDEKSMHAMSLIVIAGAF